MPDTLTCTGTLTVIECGGCHISFAIPRSLYRRLQDTRETFWCPRGHPRHFTGEPAEAQLRRLLKTAEAQATHERDQRQAAERSASAYKGQATRLRKRAAAGVCPCCNRSFQNVARHMAGQHPGFEASDG